MTTTKRNGTSKIIAIISSIIIPLLVLAAGWGANRIRVSNQGRQIVEVKETSERINARQDEQIQILRDGVTEQSTNIKWIRAKLEKEHQ